MNKNRANKDNLQDEEKDQAYSYFQTQHTTVTLIHELISIHGVGITTGP